ncbi:MAG: MFS transporter [Muribaculaceae bacterium]|jgi:DHA2 family multidrug resistance protein-like MFS transporter|nr:MFS transporter [Muribaculaceae bacterium]
MKADKFSLHNYIAITAILIVLIMTVLDVTVVNVALPVLADKFGVSDSDTVWIVTIYQLVITMLLLPLSSAGDLYSYRKTFLTGVVIFTSASVLCAASQNFAMIIASRAIQGIGAACVMSVNIALTRLIYPREVLGRGLALNAMVIAIATAAGPTIAGSILSIASWHWLFLINVPFGIVAFILGKRLLPRNLPRQDKTGYDWVSGIENTVVFGLIFYSLGSFARKGDTVTNICLLLAGLAVGVLYVRRQLNRRNPMLPVDLFGIRLYSLSIITSVCSFIALNVAMIALPFLFLNSYGFSEITTGLLMTPWPLATMIVSPLAARFVEKHNPGKTAAAGMAVYAAGITLLLLLPDSGVRVWDIAWRMVVCGIGFGLFQTPNNIVMVIATPIKRTGGAGGMQSTARLVGQTLGATIVTVVFALMSATSKPVGTCLYIALGAAIIAGVFSLSRAGKIRYLSV